LPESVAICDVADPACNWTPHDPIEMLRGVSEANIQNNLIRCLVGQDRTAFLGIDDGDTSVAFGTPTGPTNAFDPTLVGGPSVDPAQTFCSNIVSVFGAPVAKVNPNPTAAGGADPAFVGEMLTNLSLLPLSVGRDWRILPDSVLVDAGSRPAAGATGMILRASNLTEYIEPETTPLNYMPLSSFDFDGEGYGNERVRGDFADIGYDETQLLIDAGFGNDTILHGVFGCDGHCSSTSGEEVAELIFPGPGTYKVELTVSASRFPAPMLGTFPAVGFYWAYSTLFGTIVPPSPATPVPDATYWMQTSSSAFTFYSMISPALTVNAVTNYFPPFDPTNAHSFGRTAFSMAASDLGCIYVNQQGRFTPTGGVRVLTNLQSSYHD
jgi:hypothetical protein